MPQQIDLAFAMGLAPEKAVEYFKSKGYTLSWDWQDTWQEAHAIAFTVAKAGRLDVLQAIRDELQRALDAGVTLQEFRRTLEPRLKALGWWGRVTVAGDGGAETVQLGSAWRLETIYRTNMQSAYSAGRWAQQQANAGARPYLQYVAVLDGATRPGHRALHGKVFRADDQIWTSIYPPNGYGCRCSVRALTKQEVDERGLTVESSDGRLSQRDVVINQKTGEIGEVTVYRFTNPATGETIEMAPDPGFNFNPGQAAWQPDLEKYSPELRAAYQRYVKAKGA